MEKTRGAAQTFPASPPVSPALIGDPYAHPSLLKWTEKGGGGEREDVVTVLPLQGLGENADQGFHSGDLPALHPPLCPILEGQPGVRGSGGQRCGGSHGDGIRLIDFRSCTEEVSIDIDTGEVKPRSGGEGRNCKGGKTEERAGESPR